MNISKKKRFLIKGAWKALDNTYRSDESKWVRCSSCIYRQECETRELRTSCAMGVKEKIR